MTLLEFNSIWHYLSTLIIKSGFLAYNDYTQAKAGSPYASNYKPGDALGSSCAIVYLLLTRVQ